MDQTQHTNRLDPSHTQLRPHADIFPVLAPIRIALLGLWHVHASDYAEDLEQESERARLTQVWDADCREESSRFRSRFKVPAAQRLRQILVDPEVDGVVIAGATVHHKRLLSAALTAGKHVFMEKPLAATVQDAEMMVRRARESGKVVHVGLSQLHRGYLRLGKELIESGTLGTVTSVRIRYAHNGVVDPPWLPSRFLDAEESGGGVAIDLAAHPLYMARALLGNPDEVRAFGTSVSGSSVEDNLAVVMRFAGGAIAVAESSFVAEPLPITLEIHGTLGSYLWPGRSAGCASLIQRRIHRELAPPPDGERPLAAWLTAIQHGDTRTNLDDALALSVLIDRVQRAL